MMTSKPEHLYLHVPFCKVICSYCDFTHSVYQQSNGDKWLEAVEKELFSRKINTDLKTIYIGGGTPTSLSNEQLESLLSLLDQYAGKVKEYTIEINPETFDNQKAKILKKHAVNRASIGLQSSDHDILQLMNRHHTLEDVAHTMQLLREVGITNISLDLMYSFPTQTMDILKQSIQDAVALQPKHLSLYSLTIEDNTLLARKGYDHLDEDTEADMYELLCAELPKYGYTQYEVANFAQSGYESQHNCAYWNYHDFYGIGAGASGKESGVRYDHTGNLKNYIEDPLHQEDTVLTRKDQMFETVMMGIRLKRGIDKQRFQEVFDCSMNDIFHEAIEKWKKQGMLEENDRYLYASQGGFSIMNTILLDFLD